MAQGRRFRLVSVARPLVSVLAQDYSPIEVIVVDDGSTDGSAEVAKARPVRLIRRAHAGISAARNAGIQAASGDLVAFLDADDAWLPGSLSTRANHLIEHPEIDYVRAHMEIVCEPGVELPSWLPEDWAARPQPGVLQTFIGRRSLIERVGGFDERFAVGEDADWLARIKDSGAHGAMIEDVCARYRRHPGSTTIRLGRQVRPTLVRALRESLRRQREGASR